MNYLEDYVHFYSGENRKAIYRNFHLFVESWRTNNLTIISNLITRDCVADISMLGHLEGADSISQGLFWPGPKMDIRKISISNFVERSHGSFAQQSAYVQCIFAMDDGDNVFPFIFGGHFCNSYYKENNEWKIQHIRFDLMYESGNNSFVKDKWRLIDYGIFYGHLPMINSEFDAPWNVIPEDDEPQSDAEKIFETEFKLNFGMDCGDYCLTSACFTEDVVFNMSRHKNVNKNNPSQTDGNYYGKKDCNNFLKAKQHKEPRLQHTDTMGDLVINGDEAIAYMFRSEFNRISNKVFNRENIHTQVNTVLHINHFRKENNEWKLRKFSYIPYLDFVPVDDDCLCFDDYICGGKRWSIIIKE